MQNTTPYGHAWPHSRSQAHLHACDQEHSKDATLQGIKAACRGRGAQQQCFIAAEVRPALLCASAGSAITSDVQFLDAAHPEGAFRHVLPRQHNVEYEVQHRSGHAFITLRDEARPNSELLVAPLDDPQAMQVVVLLTCSHAAPPHRFAAGHVPSALAAPSVLVPILGAPSEVSSRPAEAALPPLPDAQPCRRSLPASQ